MRESANETQSRRQTENEAEAAAQTRIGTGTGTRYGAGAVSWQINERHMQMLQVKYSEASTVWTVRNVAQHWTVLNTLESVWLLEVLVESFSIKLILHMVFLIE